MCIRIITELPRMGDFTLFVCSKFIVTQIIKHFSFPLHLSDISLLFPECLCSRGQWSQVPETENLDGKGLNRGLDNKKLGETQGMN